MENFSPSAQGFPQGNSWCVDILTKITKNCMKIAKTVGFFGKNSRGHAIYEGG